MARRLIAALGIVVVLGLALTLLYRVWRHHGATEPHGDEEAIVVRLDRAPEPVVKFS